MDIDQVINSVLDKEGEFYLVKASLERRNKRLFLDVLVDRPGGITLDECVRLNQLISQRLDEEAIINERYALNVSSPGIGYLLTKPVDFERKLNRNLSVSFYGPDGRSRSEEGKLIEINDKQMRLEKANGKIVDIELDKIIKGKEKLEL